MRVFLVLLFLGINYNYGQSKKIDSINVKIINKNISAYRFYYSNYIGCHKKPVRFLNEYLLKEGQEYDLKISELKLPYHTFKGITLFKIENNYYLVKKKNRKTKVVFYDNVSYEEKLSRRMLVGLDYKNNELIFFSGNVFKTCVLNLFELDLNAPNTFTKYLKIKLFNYDINNLFFLKKRRRFIFFKAFSNSLNEDIIIKINKKDFNDIRVMCKENKWTEMGSYKWR